MNLSAEHVGRPVWFPPSVAMMLPLVIFVLGAGAYWGAFVRTGSIAEPIPVGSFAVAGGGIADAEGQTAPGLLLSMQSTNDQRRDRQSVRVPALEVAAGGVASPFLVPGPFTATWEGWIVLDAWNQITFSATGLGAEATLTINGAEVLHLKGPAIAGAGTPVRLNKGRNQIQLTCRSQADGAARLRLFWASQEFPVEPVPPTVLIHDANASDLMASHQMRHGRELVGTMRCTRCHATAATAATGLPGLATDAPDLSAAGSQFKTEWMAAWIRDPQSLRSHAEMPQLLTGPHAAQDAVDIAAYLSTLKAPSAGPAPTPAEDAKEVAAGARHFATLGCIGCHGANANGAAEVDLSRVAAKWQPAALVAFLEKPARHYQWIRMPDFALTGDEARQLAAYILSREQQPMPISATAHLQANAEHGKTLFTSAQCMACHSMNGLSAAPATIPSLVSLRTKTDAGCLADQAKRDQSPQAFAHVPDFALTASNRAALRAFLASDQQALTRRSLPEFAERRVTALRCAVCHERDGVDAKLTAYAGEIEAIMSANPEDAPADEHGEAGAAAGNPCPTITHAGAKLRPEWMQHLFSGALPYRTRPWLSKRMPAFPAAADLLAQGLAMEHGLPAVTPPEAVVEPSMAGATSELGEKLIGSAEGLACTTCHAVGGAPALAVFEAPGVNLGYVSQRLQKDFYHRWMLAPTRFDPTTRMPKFAADDGTMPNKDVLEGKADAQFEALWQYLSTVGRQTDFPH